MQKFEPHKHCLRCGSQFFWWEEKGESGFCSLCHYPINMPVDTPSEATIPSSTTEITNRLDRLEAALHVIQEYVFNQCVIKE